MLDNWWKAREIEVYVWLAIVGLIAVVALFAGIVKVRRHRKRLRDAGLL